MRLDRSPSGPRGPALAAALLAVVMLLLAPLAAAAPMAPVEGAPCAVGHCDTGYKAPMAASHGAAAHGSLPSGLCAVAAPCLPPPHQIVTARMAPSDAGLAGPLSLRPGKGWAEGVDPPPPRFPFR